MEISFSPTQFILVPPKLVARRDAILLARSNRLADVGSEDEYEAAVLAGREDERLLRKMTLAKSAKPARNQERAFHVSFYRWLSTHGFSAGLNALGPMPSPDALFVLAEVWELRLLRLIPVAPRDQENVEDLADLIHSLRIWATSGFSLSVELC